MLGKVPAGERVAYGVLRRLVHAALGLALLSAAPPTQPSRDLHIVALGDSLTAGYGLPRPLGFVPQLEATLRRNGVRAFVFNAGVSGDTAADAQQRLGWVLDSQPQPPDLVIVSLGGNDMLRGLAPDQTRAAMEAILAELDRRHLHVLIAGMRAAPNLGADYVHRFEEIFPELAAEHHAALYPFFLATVAGQPALNQADGLHPNFQGVKQVVSGIAPYVIRALGGA